VAGPGNILITVGAETVAAVRNLGNVNDALGDTMTRSEKMSAGLKKAALPAAAALGAIAIAGVGAAKAAIADAASADHLAQTLKRVTGAGKPAVDGMEDWISATSLASGVADDELRPAIEKLATATGSVTKAQKLANVALDIAAATGKDVDTVSTALAKGYQGQTGALVKLVPGISEASRKSKDYATIMAEVTEKTEGASKASAETAAGGLKRMQVATGELQESLGYALLPAIQAVIPVLLKMTQFAQDNVGVIKILTAAVAAVAGAIVAANVAMKVYEAAQVAIKIATTAWTAVQWLLNAALNANPIGLITVAVAALAAGIVIAYNKSETFQSIVKGAMDAVRGAVDKLVDVFGDLQRAASAAFNWIVDHWKLALFAFGPIGAAIYALVANWDAVKAAAERAAGAVTGAARTVASAFETMADAISRAVRSALGWIDDLYGKVSGVISKVQDLIGWIGKIPSIPKLPGLPSIPVPWAAAPAAAGASTRSSTRSAPAPVVVNVYGALDPESVARQIRRLLERHDRRQGSIA